MLRARNRARGSAGSSKFSGSVTMLSIGDSLTAYNGSYNSANNQYMIDSVPNWTVSKSNPCVITIPAGHTYTTGQRLYFFGFIGQPEINEIETTITVISGTQFSLDGIDSSAWTGTYASYGRIVSINVANRNLASAGFLTNMDMLTGGRINIPLKYCRGVAGDPASNFVNRLQYEFPSSFTDVNAVHLFGGRNDLNSGASAATVFASLTAARDWIWTNRGSNIKIFLGTVCPNNAATAPIIAETNALNALIRAAGSANCVIVDYDAVVNNGSNQWKTNYNVDDQHPAAMGGWYMGKTLKTAVYTKYTNGAGFVLDANNKLPNPELAGTGGSAAGVTNLGFANSAIVQISGTGGVSTDRIVSKDANDRQVLTIANPSGRATQTFGVRIDPTGLTTGVDYVAEAEVELVSFSGTGFFTEMSLRLQAIGAVNPTNPSSIVNGPISGAPVAQFDMTDMMAEGVGKYFLLRTPKLTYATGETSMRCTFTLRYDASGGSIDAVFKLRRMQVKPV